MRRASHESLVTGVVAVILAVAGAMMTAIGLGGDRPSHPSTSAEGPRPRPTAPATARPIAWRVDSSAPLFSTVSPRAKVLERSVPVHLDIPRIGIHTALMELGLNHDGTVALPPLRRRAPAGWYKYLASPGETGPAVILGHVDSRHGPAVFFALGALRAGDMVAVRRVDGSTAIFTVDLVAQYPKAAFPTGAVYGAVDHPGLRLVTCGGSFDSSRHSYRDNIVAYASLTGSRPAPPG